MLLLGLSPIMAPVFAFIIGKGLIEGFATYRAAGQWPRNEAFIARMRKRRASES